MGGGVTRRARGRTSVAWACGPRYTPPVTRPPSPRRRRGSWKWEHLALVWLLAAGAAVASTLVRFPPGRTLRPLRVRPSTLVKRGDARLALLLLRREPVLTAGWVAAPLAAVVATGVLLLRSPGGSARAHADRHGD